MSEEIIHLYVYICSDGSLMCYNPNKTLNLRFTNLTSYSSLHEIFAISNYTSAKRKGMPKEDNIKYIKYYFKNMQSNEEVSIPKEHIQNILSSIKKG